MEISGITFYDGNIKELPVARYNLFNALLLNDLGVGSDMEAVNRHLSKLIQFAAVKDTDSISIEANNLILCYYSAINKLSFKSRALAALVKSVDKKRYPAGMTDGEVEEVTAAVEKRLNAGVVEGLINTVKKKLLPDLD